MARRAARVVGKDRTISVPPAAAAGVNGPAGVTALDSAPAPASPTAVSGVTATEAYGFAGWLAALASWAAYLAWVWVPPAVWARTGVAAYVPSRYWALAGPAALVVVVCSYTLVYGALSEWRRGTWWVAAGEILASEGRQWDSRHRDSQPHDPSAALSTFAGLLLNPRLDELTTLTDGASKPPQPRAGTGDASSPAAAAASAAGREEWSVLDIADEAPQAVAARRFGPPRRTSAAAPAVVTTATNGTAKLRERLSLLIVCVARGSTCEKVSVTATCKQL
jgi:hypothetical protein